jgi:hypothetical protein
MRRTDHTKKEFLDRIWHGTASVHAVSTMTKYRVAVPGDPDPNGGVWISLSEDYEFVFEGLGSAYARVDGREVLLTRAEATRMARFIATCMRRRSTRWRYT